MAIEQPPEDRLREIGVHVRPEHHFAESGLTRLDYARARAQRTEMLSFLRNEMIDTAFLFVGFSLSDPNFNLIHDDIRLVYGMNLPASYTVQGRRNSVKERYLRSLGVNTCRLPGGWGQCELILPG